MLARPPYSNAASPYIMHAIWKKQKPQCPVTYGTFRTWWANYRTAQADTRHPIADDAGSSSQGLDLQRETGGAGVVTSGLECTWPLEVGVHTDKVCPGSTEVHDCQSSKG